MARDTSARPHELLKLSIGDVQFKIDQTTGRQYAEIVVSGKTKTRTLPLIDSVPYVKEWLSDHPARHNLEAPLFITFAPRNRGSRQTVNSLGKQYTAQYRKQVFRKVLTMSGVPEQDKEIVRGMLKKPWNLYVFRHSAITEKAQILKEATLRDHAGWTMTSKMPAIYIHFFGAESSKSLLEARGIISKDRKEDNILQSKLCPHCQEPNAPHSRFCLKCRMVLTYDEYEGVKSEFQDLVNELGRAQMDADFEREQMMEQIALLRKEIERLKERN
jgi:hypothetical protein